MQPHELWEILGTALNPAAMLSNVPGGEASKAKQQLVGVVLGKQPGHSPAGQSRGQRAARAASPGCSGRSWHRQPDGNEAARWLLTAPSAFALKTSQVSSWEKRGNLSARCTKIKKNPSTTFRMRRRRTGSKELRCSRCIWWRFCHCHRTRDRCRGAPGARCGARRLQQRPGGTPPHPGGHPRTPGIQPRPEPALGQEHE